MGPSPRAQDDLQVGFSPASVLTRAELLDHAKHPRNRGELHDANLVQEEVNPLCGDAVKIFAVIASPSTQLGVNEAKRSPRHGARIARMTFTGSGCLISQAAASMLSEAVVSKSVADIEAMERADIEALLGGAVSPSRLKCAMLPLVALKNGLQSL